VYIYRAQLKPVGFSGRCQHAMAPPICCPHRWLSSHPDALTVRIISAQQLYALCTCTCNSHINHLYCVTLQTNHSAAIKDDILP